MKVYLDNASTTFPKPQNVATSMYNFLTNMGGNPGRSNHDNSLQSNRLLLETRMQISNFFNYKKIENVIFTNNITTSLNTLIFGACKQGDHVITSSMEHNSVLRPLISLKDNNIIELDIITANKHGFLDIHSIRENIKKNTKFIILSHASNVIGSIQPIKEIGELCKKNNIFFILDTAQSAGVLDVNFDEFNLSALAFTGHKSLFGPQGVGGFIIDDKLNDICNPYILGGTGSLSHSLIQPDFLPDKYESGTLNMPGIIGLKEGITFIENEGLNTIYEKNFHLRKHLIEGLCNINNIILYDDLSSSNYTSCVSFNIKDMETSEVSFTLDNDYNISNRSGLHCAPLAHKTIGSFPSGSIRLSLSYFNTKNDIDYALASLNKISKGF